MESSVDCRNQTKKALTVQIEPEQVLTVLTKPKQALTVQTDPKQALTVQTKPKQSNHWLFKPIHSKCWLYKPNQSMNWLWKTKSKYELNVPNKSKTTGPVDCTQTQRRVVCAKPNQNTWWLHNNKNSKLAAPDQNSEI